MINRDKARFWPTVEPYMKNKLSPLDQIRNAEAEVAREIAAAREAAKGKVVEAEMQAETLIREARDAGNREGQTQHNEILSRANEEAKALIAQSQNRAGELRRQGRQRMEAAVNHVLEIIVRADVEA
jgi:vacuolar-type H+-ATPase subunit H